jgi:polysaccharide chain length determinant protein (PEP-CTERM system associated)
LKEGTMSDPSGASRLERLALVARRRRGLAVAVFAMTAAAGVTVALSLPNIYRATASVLVEQGRGEAAQGDIESRLQVISQEILSRARLEGVIREFGLYPNLVRGSSPQAAVGQMRRDIRTEFKGGIGGTNFFTVSYRNVDPELSARVTNALAAFYIEGDRKIREQQTSGAVRLLKSQVDELKEDLRQQEEELAAFQVKHARELPQQADVNVADLQGLHAELRTTSEERMRLLDRRNETLRQLAASAPEDSPATAGPTPVETKLARLKDELTSLRQRYSDKYPDVVRLKGEVAALEKEAAESRATAPPPAAASAASSRVAARLRESLAETEEEITARKGDELRLRAEIAERIRRLENAPLQQRSYQEISRDYQTRRDLYDSLRKRYEQAQLEEDQAARPSSPFRILDAAVVPSLPDAPNRRVLSVVALLVALGLAAAAAALAERLDTSFHAADDVRAFTRVPVLASIPAIVTAGDRRARWLRLGVGAMALCVALVAVVQASHRLSRNKVGVVAMLARP